MNTHPHCHSHTQSNRHRPDFLLWGSLTTVLLAYGIHVLEPDLTENLPYVPLFSHSAYALLNKMWWGLLLGILFVGLLSKVPREFVSAVIGQGGSTGGVVRATVAGLLLDLCSHGILLVGMKLYERGASLGQVMAFLIASPWNSLSLTIILIALVGWQWTLLFIVASAAIAIFSGVLFDFLVMRGHLPPNPHKTELREQFHFWPEAKKRLAETHFDAPFFSTMIRSGLGESKMILRWIFFGIVLASLLRTFVSPDQFGTYFGPSLAGLGLTVLVATLLEVCSEGSTPIAADILNRANAPGNAFAFLMTGVSTDYTEILALKETTRSWKIALFLPLVTVPQVLLLSWAINGLL